jgi:hypothetical protein
MSEDLRQALRRIDPAPPQRPVDGVDSASARRLLGEIMAVPTDTEVVPLPDRPPARRRWPVVATAAALALVAAAGVGLAVRDDDAARPAPTTLTLTMPDPLTSSSCLMFDVNALAQMPMAFGGTVTQADGDSVTIDVDRWYRGGDADQVRLAVPGGATSVALDGVEFEPGKRYLVAAAGGNVNGCGFSGPATPELTRSYEQAFGS